MCNVVNTCFLRPFGIDENIHGREPGQKEQRAFGDNLQHFQHQSIQEAEKESEQDCSGGIPQNILGASKHGLGGGGLYNSMRLERELRIVKISNF